MELFEKIYNCYYNVVRHILAEASAHPILRRDMERICQDYGFGESSLTIIPKLTDGTWPLLIQSGGRSYVSRLPQAPPRLPLTGLQSSWLLSLLSDRRFCLFFSDEELEQLRLAFPSAAPLYEQQDFYYFDQYGDRDSYDSPVYRKNFQTILEALRNHRALLAAYSGKHGEHTYEIAPCQLQYSSKDDKFRLRCLLRVHGTFCRSMILNLARIRDCHLSRETAPDSLQEYRFQPTQRADEPVLLAISGERNSLERCMLHFASYEKHTEYDESKNRWLCSIYYDLPDETELLIDILSFGPVVQVLGPPSFLRQVRRRVRRQHELFYGTVGDEGGGKTV